MSSQGRELTSFRSPSPPHHAAAADSTSHSRTAAPAPSADKARYIPDATDLIYHALRAEKIITAALPAVFSEATAIDTARFAGEGASFAVYRRHVPPRKKVERPVDSGEGWTISTSNNTLRLPEVIAYKVPRIDFTDRGHPTEDTRHSMLATVMELYITSHPALQRHKNIVDFLGLAWSTSPFSLSHKTPVLVAEFSELGSLADVQRRQYVPLCTRRKLCLDVCWGLQALHDCNVLHGDIKAENVLLFPDNEHGMIAKLSDFGYSHVLEHAQVDFSIGGTWPWRASETNERVARATAKSTDVYSLSLLIWCTLAHGVNIFKAVLPTTAPGDAFRQAVEDLKISNALADHTALQSWYPGILQTLAGRREALDRTQISQLMSRLHIRVAEIQQGNDMWAAMEAVEEVAILILSTYPPGFPVVAQMFGNIGPLPPVMAALAGGISTDPDKRNFAAILQSLGHSSEAVKTNEAEIREAPFKHMFQWSDWPSMEPWLQAYISSLIEQRRDLDWQQTLINPPEALFLAILYTNGYGLESNTTKAIEWMRRAMRAGLHTATAYSYRHLIGCGYRLDDPRAAVPSLNSMAIRGSRTALEDMQTLWPEKFDETRQMLRDNLAGWGADFFFETEMLGRNKLGNWISTLKDIDKTLPLFEKFQNVAEHRINKRGDRIMHLAASCGQTHAIEVLLKHFAGVLDVNQPNDRGETLLLCACRAGQLMTAIWLLEVAYADASINAQNGESPLHWLVSFDSDEIARLAPALIRAGASVDTKTQSVVSYHPQFQSGFVPDRFAMGYPIGWATLCNRPDIVQALLSYTKDPTIAAQNWPRVNSALQIAASQHRAECLRLMTDAIKAFNVENKRHEYASVTITDLLGQAMHNSDLFNLTIFHGAKWKENLYATMKLLVPLTNRIFTPGYGRHGFTLLYWAVSLARDEMVEYLLTQAWNDMRDGPHFDEDTILKSDVGAFCQSDIDKRCGPEQRTPFLEAVRWNRPSLARKLLDHGASPTICGKNPFSGEDATWTALHVLAQSAHNTTELPTLLHDHAIPIDGLEAHHPTTESPFLLAIQNDCLALASRLASLGANPNFTTASSGLHTLAHPSTVLGHLITTTARNSVARIRFLLTDFEDAVAPIVEPARAWTALHRAAAAHLDAAFRATDQTHGMPLQWRDVDWEANAAVTAELLVRLPAGVRDALETGRGDTALHLAVRAANPGAARLLVMHGARGDVVNAEGEEAGVLALRLWAEERLAIAGAGEMEGEAAARKECVELLAGARPGAEHGGAGQRR